MGDTKYFMGRYHNDKEFRNRVIHHSVKYHKNNREKVNKNVKKLRKEKKAYFMSLLGNKCLNCGYDKCINALEFHHINGNKNKRRDYLSQSFEIILQEIQNGELILLCANCHREKHADNSWLNHPATDALSSYVPYQHRLGDLLKPLPA